MADRDVPNRVENGPSCSGCGLPNYRGLCPHCRGDQDAYERELVPPFPTSREGLDVERLARALRATRHRITSVRIGGETWVEAPDFDVVDAEAIAAEYARLTEASELRAVR